MNIDERYEVLDAAKSNNPLIKLALGSIGVVCSTLGPMRREELYQQAVAEELKETKDLEVVSEHKVPVIYNGKEVGHGRCDLLLKTKEHKLVIEFKGGRSTARTAKVDIYQLMHYLNDLKEDTGLLAYCGVPGQDVVDIYVAVRVGSVSKQVELPSMHSDSWAVIKVAQAITIKPAHVFFS